MRIELRQQGGFAGLRRPPIVIETEELEPGIAHELETLAAALPAGGPGGRVGADLMRYDVLVDEPGGRRSATFFEPDVPAEVRELLRLARAAGRRKP